MTWEELCQTEFLSIDFSDFLQHIIFFKSVNSLFLDLFFFTEK